MLTLTLTFYSGGEEKEGKYSEKENIFFLEEKKTEKEKEENIWRKSLKDTEKSRFRFLSRDFCQILEGFGIGFGEFGLGKKSQFWFWRILSPKKVMVSVSENLVSKKSLGFGFGEFGLGKKSRFRFQTIWYREKSLGIGFGQNFGIGIQ